MPYPKCPECGQDIVVRKIKRLSKDGYCYHQCYKCNAIIDVTVKS